jgi:hypothetical protein
MALDANGEYDGICACGKKEADGVRCFLGATHMPLNRQPYKPRLMPWEAQFIPARVAEPSLPWTQTKLPWE